MNLLWNTCKIHNLGLICNFVFLSMYMTNVWLMFNVYWPLQQNKCIPVCLHWRTLFRSTGLNAKHIITLSFVWSSTLIDCVYLIHLDGNGKRFLSHRFFFLLLLGHTHWQYFIYISFNTSSVCLWNCPPSFFGFVLL